MQQTIEHFNKMKKTLWIKKGDNSVRIDKRVWALQKPSYIIWNFMLPHCTIAYIYMYQMRTEKN